MPKSLFGYLRVQRPLSLVNDYFNADLFYPELTVRLKAGLIVKEPPDAYCLHGNRGSFVKQRADVQEDTLKQGLKPGASDWGKEAPDAAGVLNISRNGLTFRTVIPSLQGNYMEFYDALYKAIKDKEKLPVSAEDGLNVMRIIEAVQKSDHLGSIISV